jgi:hypothetical protein
MLSFKGFPYPDRETDVQQFFLVLDREPGDPTYTLTPVCQERLSLGKRVPKQAKIPEQVFLRCVAQPLDAIGKNRDRRVIYSGPFHCPTGIPDHDLAERDALFRAANKDVTRQL